MAVSRLALYVPAALVLVGWLVGTHFSGGYFARDWYPAGIALVLLLAITALAGGRALPQATVLRIGLALLAGFVAWSYLSMLWAGSPGSAWEASNKLLLYLVTAWVLALVPWTGRSAAIFLGAWSVGVAGVCAIALLEAVVAKDVAGFIYAFRFQSPIGYPNANAALGVMAFLPALALSYQRRAPAAVQGVLLGAASFSLEFSLLAQSRAAVAAAALVLVLLLAVAPSRWRLLLRMVVLGVALAVSIGPILDVYSTAEAGRALGPAIDRAALWMVSTSLLAGIVGAAIGGLESRIRLGAAGRLRARRAGVACVSLFVAALVLLAALYGGRVAHFTDRELSAITSGKEASKAGSTRFAKTTLYERPDYWRVSLEMFREHPLGGAGAGNFEQQYTVHRDQPKYSRYAHDVWLRALGETGIVGLALLVAFALLVVAVPLRRVRALDEWGRAVVTGCLAVVVYFLLHASFDWLDEIPALAAPAIGLAFVGLAVARPPRASEQRAFGEGAAGRASPAARRRHAAARVGVVLGPVALAAAALVALVPPYLSQRYVGQALSGWKVDSAGSFRDLNRAAALNPLSSVPRMTEGTIAVSLGRDGRARRSFGQALEIEQLWYPHMELALLDAQAGRFRLARREISAASRLSRKDPFIAEARGLILARSGVDARAFNLAMESQIRNTFTTQQGSVATQRK
jgi:O-antigen ligase